MKKEYETKTRTKSNLFALFLGALLSIQGCSSTARPQLLTRPSQSYKQSSGDTEVILAQNARAIKAELTVVAEVVRLLREDDQGEPHQKFLIGLSNSTTVLVAHNIRIAPRVPLKVGDTVKIHGEYIWNAKGGLIHWTHVSDSPKHESGWIELNNTRYQ